MVFDRCNRYPSGGGWPELLIQELCVDSLGNPYSLGSFISQIPNGPLAGEQYGLTVNDTYTDYVLRATLETKSSALNDDVDGTVLNGMDCSDASNYYCVQPK